MALSSFFDFQTPQTFDSDQLLLDDPLCCYDGFTSITDSFVDPWYHLSSFSCHAEDCAHLLPHFSSSTSDPFLNVPPPMFSPPEEDHFHSLYPNPKRHKCFHAPAYFDWSAPFSCPKPELAVEMFTPLPDCEPPKIQSGECNWKETGERGLSAQSIAARERRRKITEKTQELGRLIPGGAKMNTAEMLQAAFKYVKYLQAQLGILQMMEPFEKSEDLQSLLSSPLVEEKLYMEDKCLATPEFVLTIANDHDEALKPPVYEQLFRLFTSNP